MENQENWIEISIWFLKKIYRNLFTTENWEIKDLNKWQLIGYSLLIILIVSIPYIWLVLLILSFLFIYTSKTKQEWINNITKKIVAYINKKLNIQDNKETSFSVINWGKDEFIKNESETLKNYIGEHNKNIQKEIINNTWNDSLNSNNTIKLAWFNITNRSIIRIIIVIFFIVTIIYNWFHIIDFIFIVIFMLIDLLLLINQFYRKHIILLLHILMLLLISILVYIILFAGLSLSTSESEWVFRWLFIAWAVIYYIVFIPKIISLFTLNKNVWNLRFISEITILWSFIIIIFFSFIRDFPYIIQTPLWDMYVFNNSKYRVEESINSFTVKNIKESYSRTNFEDQQKVLELTIEYQAIAEWYYNARISPDGNKLNCTNKNNNYIKDSSGKINGIIGISCINWHSCNDCLNKENKEKYLVHCKHCEVESFNISIYRTIQNDFMWTNFNPIKIKEINYKLVNENYFKSE